VTGRTPRSERVRIAHWSSYAPAKRRDDAKLVPLTPDEIFGLAADYRRQAANLEAAGDVELAERLRRAADDVQGRTESER